MQIFNGVVCKYGFSVPTSISLLSFFRHQQQDQNKEEKNTECCSSQLKWHQQQAKQPTLFNETCETQEEKEEDDETRESNCSKSDDSSSSPPKKKTTRRRLPAISTKIPPTVSSSLTENLMPLSPLRLHHEVSYHFRELYIYSGYRCPASLGECCLSLFQSNNETLNVWTHLLPSFYFLWRFLALLHSLNWQPWNHVYLWPLMCCTMGAMVYTLVSANAHLFNVLSPRARHLCFFLDYAGVSFYGQCTAIACFAYSMPDAWCKQGHWAKQGYLLAAGLLSCCSVLVSSKTRFMTASPTRTLLRLCAFAVPYLCDNLPIFFRHLTAPSTATINSTHWISHYSLAFISVFLYASHLPERLFPGHFDVIGHSHQLFHIFGVMCTRHLLDALANDMTTRREFFASVGHWPSDWTTYKSLLLVLLGNLATVIYFARRSVVMRAS